MKEPLFRVGEEAIAVSPAGHIWDVIITESKYFKKGILSTGETCPGWGYKLVAGVSETEYFHPEKYLRKKHPPADESFDELMARLKSPQKEKS